MNRTFNGANMKLCDATLLSWMRFCAYFFCAATTTVSAHFCIDYCMSFSHGENTYDAYAHVALGPLFLTAGAAAAIAIARSIVLILAQRERCDVVVFTARLMPSVAPAKLVLITFLCAVVLLFGIEAYEQVAELGRFEGFVEALGGNIALGLSVIAVLSSVVIGAVLGGVHLLRRAVGISCKLIVGFFVQRTLKLSFAGARHANTVRRSIFVQAELLLAYCLGLRAPPFPA